MILVGLPIFALGLFLAFQMPKTYESRSSLYVTSGDEVRTSSILSDQSFDPGPGIQEVIQGELQILQTQLVAERTLSRFPLDRIYPKLAEARDKALAQGSAEEADAIEFEFFQKGVKALQDGFWADATPNSNIISVGFNVGSRRNAVLKTRNESFHFAESGASSLAISSSCSEYSCCEES